jgi:hypothetical protein
MRHKHCRFKCCSWCGELIRPAEPEPRDPLEEKIEKICFAIAGIGVLVLIVFCIVRYIINLLNELNFWRWILK